MSFFEDENDLVRTGIISLDNEIGGFRNGSLYTIAGRPEIGKSTLALSVLHNVVMNQELPAAIFSYEMKGSDVLRRLVAIESGIPYIDILNDSLEDYQRHDLSMNNHSLSEASLFIESSIRQRIDELGETCRKLKAEQGIRLVIIDDIQRIPIDEKSRKFAVNREQEISSNVRELKRLARELDLPIIIISQLNRSVEIRGGDRKPLLIDLRDSGAIENDSDVVIFVYRPDYYGFMQDVEGNLNEGVADLIIAKNRFGIQSNARIHFNKNIPKFESIVETNSVNDEYTIPSKFEGLNRLNGESEDSPF